MAILRIRNFPNNGLPLPAGQQTPNLLAGSKFEFLPARASVHLWATQDGTVPLASIDFTLGNVVVGEDLFPNIATTPGNIQRNTDGIGSGAGVVNDRIQIRVRNNSAANSVNVTILLEINEF